jgi:hypothetical protein
MESQGKVEQEEEDEHKGENVAYTILLEGVVEIWVPWKVVPLCL